MAETDWTRAIERIMPTPGAEDVLRMRTGVVDELNSDGTADVEVSGLLIPSLPVVDGAKVVVSDPVMLLSWRGSLVVLGAVGVPNPATVPTGAILDFAGATAPTGYLLCDGAAVSRTTYAALFSTIGTTYGVGNGSTTFNLPDFRGRMSIGVGDGTATGHTDHPLGQAGGEETHVLTVTEMPSHSHVAYGALIPRGTGAQFRELTSSPGSNNVSTGSAGGGQAHNNMSPFLTVNKIIKT